MADTSGNTRSISIEIDLTAIRANFSVARRLSGGSKLFATVKADAYGHGAVEVARALSSGGGLSGQNDSFVCADGFAVVSVDEAIELRQAGIKQPVLVLQGPQSADACDLFQQYDLWPVIHDQYQLVWFRETAQATRLRAWLKVDTGMGRLGIKPGTVESTLSENPHIQWMGVLTHFACADETRNDFTLQQIDTFNSVTSSLNLQRSLANSAAVLAWTQSRAEWARPGIMLYGCNPLDIDLPQDVVLTPAMTVRAPLLAVKNLSAGAGIGYAQTWHCPEDMPVGYVASGYRDGIPRVLDSTAGVMVDGQLCPVIGRVSMDSIAIDLRACPEARPGTHATLWGKSLPVEHLAAAAGTINYELLTSVRGRRLYIP